MQRTQIAVDTNFWYFRVTRHRSVASSKSHDIDRGCRPSHTTSIGGVVQVTRHRSGASSKVMELKFYTRKIVKSLLIQYIRETLETINLFMNN